MTEKGKMPNGQLNLFPSSSDGLIQQTLQKVDLPSLPSIFRYDDDFAGMIRTVRCDENVWHFRLDGKSSKLVWQDFSTNQEHILKHFVIWIAANLDASTLIGYVSSLGSYKKEIQLAIPKLLCVSPNEARVNWEHSLRQNFKVMEQNLFRSFATFICEFGLLSWTVEESTELPLVF